MTADYQNPKIVKTDHRRYANVTVTNIHRITGARTLAGTYDNVRYWTDRVEKGPDIPGWRYKLSIGHDVTTQLVGWRITHTYRDAYMWSPIKPAYGTQNVLAVGVYQNGFNSDAVSTSTDAECSSKAASAFLNDYLENLSAWRGGNSIAEFRETVKALSEPTKVLYQQSWDFTGNLGKLKRVYRQNPHAYAKQICDLWLGYSLAIKPTVSDIDDCWSAVAKLSRSLGCYDLKKIVGSHKRSQLVSCGLQSEPGFSQARKNRSVYDTRQVRFRGYLRCSPVGSNIGVMQNFGVTFDDILPAVWEAIPFSFVLDYFVNIQECLDAIRYLRNEPVGLSRTDFNARMTIDSDLIGSPDIAHDYTTAYGGRCKTYSTFVRRTRLNSVTYPGLQFRCPGLGSPKWLNIAALAGNFLRSSPYGKLARGIGL